MFSFGGICFIPGFNAARLCAEKSMRYESPSFKVRLLSSALCYPGMSLHNPTGMATLSNLSVSLLAVGFSLSSFHIFCSVFEKRIFILNPFVNVHLFSQRVFVSGS